MNTFEYLHVKNFLSIGEARLEYQNGMHLVKGENCDNEKGRSNGTGKSAFLVDALSWCLYGLTSKKKEADSVVNRYVGKDCHVIAQWKMIDNRVIRVERYRAHKKHNNNLMLFIDGVDTTKKRNSDTQKDIDELFGIPWELFNSCQSLTQGLNNRFSLLKDTARREAIESLRPGKIWENSRNITKSRIERASKELRTIQDNIIAANTQLQQEKTLSKQWLEQIGLLQTELRNQDNLPKLALLQDSLTAKSLEHERLNLNLKSISELKSSKDYSNVCFGLQEKINNLKTGEFFAKQSRLSFVTERLNNPEVKCPSCGTVLKSLLESEKDELTQEQGLLNGYFGGLALQERELSTELQRIRAELAEINFSAGTSPS